MGSCCGCCRSGAERGQQGPGHPSKASDTPTVNPKILVALFDYVPGSLAEVALKKGDRVQLISMEPENFVFVRIAKTHGTRGYVPAEYVAPVDSDEAEDFFYGNIRGKQANAVLSDPTLPAGTFLIRTSEGQKKTDDEYEEVIGDATFTPYALSMKDGSTPPQIHHYRIVMTEFQECFIKVEKRFPSVPALIAYYQKSADGLPCKLSKCLPRPVPPKRELPAEMRERWREIPREQLKLDKLLGEGRFGEVHKAIWTQPNGQKLTVVAKQLKQLSLPDKQMLLNEASTMKDLCHENVIRFYGVVSASEPYYLITEYVKDGSLEDYLRDREQYHRPQLPASAMVDICGQICKGMAHLASKRLVHRDLAARNVLIDVKTETPYTCVVKVADFGLARSLNRQYIYKMRHETYIATRWLAPEAYDTSVFSPETDVWAFGITLAEIYHNGKDPWNDISDAKMVARMKAGQAPDKPPSMPESVHDIMKRCCQLKPSLRPKFKELVLEFDALLTSMTGKSSQKSLAGSCKSLGQGRKSSDSLSRASKTSKQSLKTV